jgi:hypothetical protein
VFDPFDLTDIDIRLPRLRRTRKWQRVTDTGGGRTADLPRSGLRSTVQTVSGFAPVLVGEVRATTAIR